MRVLSRSQDMAAQEPDLKRWADAHGDNVGWFRDKAAGRKMAQIARVTGLSRPTVYRLLEAD